MSSPASRAVRAASIGYRVAAAGRDDQQGTGGGGVEPPDQLPADALAPLRVGTGGAPSGADAIVEEGRHPGRSAGPVVPLEGQDLGVAAAEDVQQAAVAQTLGERVRCRCHLVHVQPADGGGEGLADRLRVAHPARHGGDTAGGVTPGKLSVV